MPAATDFSTLDPDTQDSLWGVIIYAPEDVAWCEWLYFTLNGYTAPPERAGRPTRHGFPRPQQISVACEPELEAFAAPTASTGAVNQAKYLIVIVSPSSADCHRIDGQIRAFKRNGGEERIIALVIDGGMDGYASAANSSWLPAWLRWRLQSDNSFVAADQSEPLVIDARAGRANLDEVMGSVIAALLDLPAEEVVQAPSGADDLAPERSQAAAAQSVWEELNRACEIHPGADAEIAPKPASARRRLVLAGGIAVVAATAGGLIYAFADPFKKPLQAVAAAAAPAPPAPAFQAASQPKPVDLAAATPWPESAPEPVPEPAMATAPAPVAASEPPAVADSAPPAPEPVASIASASPPAPAEPAVVETMPPPPTKEVALPEPSDAEIFRGEADALLKLAERAVLRNKEESMELYATALSSAKKYAGAKGAGSEAQMRVVRLSLTLGALQAQYASSAEARVTLQHGLKLLLKMKGGKSFSSEKSRLTSDFKLQLRRLNDTGDLD